MSPQRSSEMERIAREARQFREAEAQRIAAEKDAARRALELQKQKERERIALQSGQFLQDTVKEQELMLQLKSQSMQQHREEELKLETAAAVAEKARQLSEKEQQERQRLEQEQQLLRQRQAFKKSSSSQDSEMDVRSLQSFSGDFEDGEDDHEARAYSRQSTMYYDAAMSQSFLEATTAPAIELTNDSRQTPSKQFKKSETVYYDASPSNVAVGGSTMDSPETFETPMPINYHQETTGTIYHDPQASLLSTPRGPEYFQTPGQASLEVVDSTAGGDSFQSPMPQQTATDPTPKGTVYYDASTMKETTSSIEITSPAGIQARALFAGKDEYLIPSNADPHSEERIMAHRPTKGLGKICKKDSPDEDELVVHNRVHEASYEIPIEYNPSTGSFTVTRDAEISMSTSMAPSRLDGKWSGRLEGKASMGPSAETNMAVGSATLDYAVNSWSKLSLGMIRGHELYHPLITVGGSLLRHGSVLGVTFYHNAQFLHAMMLEHSMYSISFRHVFPTSRWVFSSDLSRRQDLTLAISNSKLSSQVIWSLRNPQRLATRVDIRPTLRKDRTAHIFAEYKSFGAWQLGGTLIQSLHSKIATIGMGVRLYSTRGLEWILSWNRGDATVRIPIIVTSGIRSVNVGQILYFSMISFLLQEGIAELWGWNNVTVKDVEDEDARSAATNSTNNAKARQDALLQRDLMARQAKRKTDEEVDKSGLIIHKATYSVKGGEKWDATIPLQFWVNRSSLHLPAKSKSQLLGFYDISIQEKATLNTLDRLESSSLGLSSWWKSVWSDLLDSSLGPSQLQSVNGATRPTPTLTVRYDFQGQAYQITIRDEQELILPNPAAKRL